MKSMRSLQCYYPDCQVPSVSIFGDGEKKNVDIAHICATSSNGPRFRASMTEDEIDSFSNLILLCDLHHRMVDKKKNEYRFTEEVLRKWKEENEKEIKDKINGLSRLTESSLNEMLTTAAESTKNEINDALGELKDISGDAAELLRSLYSKIENHYIDSDSIAMLHAASHRLGYLEEGANLLHSASQRLGYLEEGAHLIDAASQRLGNLEERSAALNAAANQIGELEGVVHMFASATENFRKMNPISRLEQVKADYVTILQQTPGIPDIEGSIEAAGRSLLGEIDRKLETVNNMQPPMVINDEQRWKFGLSGFAAGVLSVLVTVAILAYNGSV